MIPRDPANGRPGNLQAYLDPFESSGTASFPTHKFYMTSFHNEKEILARFEINPPQSVYYYDPIMVPGDDAATQANLDALSHEEFELYQTLVTSRDFGKEYFNFTGREYLSLYPRNAPSHKIWRADYFGQEHWVTSQETHFVDLPDEKELGGIKEKGRERKLMDNEVSPFCVLFYCLSL